VIGWQSYPETVAQHTVTGDLRVYRGLHSPQLDNARDVLAWLPPSYELPGQTDRRYPVVYMHDGQNLFDTHTSYAGEWRVDETMTALAAEGIEAIIVGLPNAGADRSVEYNPHDTRHSFRRTVGRGEQYTRFLIDTVKPLIDGSFRTQPDAAATGIAGSSMGGLISLYAFLKYPEVFGLCGAFSTAYWFSRPAFLDTVRTSAQGLGRVYLDAGTEEGSSRRRWKIVGARSKDVFRDDVRALRDILLSRGYVDGRSLRYVEAAGARHHESAWAERLPDAMRFLLRP
jgi:predicted alpha/beta superfamily hydrolase